MKTVTISKEDFQLIKSFYPEFKRARGIQKNDYVIDWNELMPVVEKINNLFDNGKMEGFDTDIFRSMQDWILSVNIENAYADLVEIIKWYNQQKA